MDTRLNARRILIFLAITYGLSLAVYLAIFLGGRQSGSDLNLGAGRLVLMFAPMVAAIAARLITREGWSNTYLRPSFGGGRWRYYLAAWFLPPAATLVGAAIYYLLSPGHFDPYMTAYREMAGASSEGATEFFLTRVFIAMVSPVTTALVVCFGEESGWRAYLLPKVMALGPRKAILVVGVIHGVWHWPSILMGSDYGFGYWGAPVMGLLLFVVMACLSSAIYAWLTLRSGSVCPAVIFHGAFNNSNQLAWIFFGGEFTPLLGPAAQGAIGMLGYAALGLLIFFGRQALAPAAAPRSVEPGAAQAELQPTA
jgi:membrane protease YdiL (CAAX protease family)